MITKDRLEVQEILDDVVGTLDQWYVGEYCNPDSEDLDKQYKVKYVNGTLGEIVVQYVPSNCSGIRSEQTFKISIQVEEK